MAADTSVAPADASSIAAGEGGFVLKFRLVQAGTVKFYVSYSLMFARFGNTYAVFANQV
jgi:hypothetical protein